MKWTAEQQAAIEARNSNLLVSAAAGSGKTAVLVERILQLIIKDGVDIDRMLIVTFTNAAAGEMRERIGNALMEAMEKEQGWDDHLRQQINLLSRASISTVHSFCMNIVRKYFYAIDLDPGFRIGDEAECNIIKLEALDALLEREYQKGSSEFLGLVDRFGNNRHDTSVRDLILRLHNFIKSKPNPEEWLSLRVEDFLVSVDNIKDAPWYKVLVNHIELELRGAIALLENALKLCQAPCGPKPYEENINGDILKLENLLAVLHNKGLVAFCDELSLIKFSTLKRCGKDVDDELKEEVKNLREQAKDIVNKELSELFGPGFEISIRRLNELHPYMECLYRLVVELEHDYMLHKQERGIIDFNDLEHFALKILENEEIAGEIREKYDYIFVDEYQDSNIIQETILNKICRKDNMFMVGDVKQSIYRFRLADPSIFLDKYDKFRHEPGALNRRIDLNKNFRSRPEILNGVNFIFKHIMSKSFGEIDYDEKAALYQGSDFEPIEHPEIELHLIDLAEKSETYDNMNTEMADDNAGPETDESTRDDMEEAGLELESLDDIEVEAMMTAQRIKELLDTDIYDPRLVPKHVSSNEQSGNGASSDSAENINKGGYRKVTYRDIVILLRSTKGYASVFQEVLTSMGIPVYADFDTGYFEAIEVKTIVNLLKIIDNKYQDIPLLSVLRSPIGGFDVQDLIKIRINSKNKTFYEATADYMNSFDDDLASRLRDFYRQIEEWQEASRYLPMEEFLWKLYMESGYYYYAGAMPGGKQRQANLKVLLDRAAKFQQSSIRGLFQFIQFIDKLRSGSGDMGVAKTLNENDNVVRLMSVHKSKGLEFPIVIVAGLGKQFNLQDTSAAVLFHKDLGLGPRYVNPDTRQACDTISKAIMKQVIKLENLSEEMRILYVALTRPKDKLILVGSVKDLNKAAVRWSQRITPYILSRGKTYLDWICPVLMRHIDCIPLRMLLSLEGKGADIPIIEDPSCWSIFIHSREELADVKTTASQSEQELMELLHDPSAYTADEYLELIDERFSWEYAYGYAVNIPSKVAVTELKQINSIGVSLPHGSNTYLLNEPVLIERPKFMEGTKRFTAAEIGTIIHYVLQHLDLERVQSPKMISQQLDEMVEKELLTREEKEVVNIDTIMDFYRSDIGRRILNAPKVYREVSFNYRKDASEVIESLDIKGEELLVQGVIDCYFEEDDGWVLVDYKTDYVWGMNGAFEYPGKREITYSEEMPPAVKSIVDRYRLQIDLYAEALEKITAKPVVEKILYLLSINLAVIL